MFVPFSERIKKRHRLWWGDGRGLRGWFKRVHRRKECFSYRTPDDEENRWRCCEYWQRTLANKWNSRQFALRHGCQVPALYWTGRRIETIPFNRLPESYVIRPYYGYSNKNIFVVKDDFEIFSQTRCPRRQMRERLIERFGRVSRIPLLVEEFIADGARENKLPIDYKVHVFGETIGAVVTVLREGKSDLTKHRYYTPQWESFADPMSTYLSLCEEMPPPAHLTQILAAARRLGQAYGTYVRVDLYAAPRGVIFGEFTGTPLVGQTFTPFADRYFGELWQQHIGDKI